MMKDFFSVSPLKILSQASYNQLGPGNLGALIARAGVGKTACLIRIALDRIFRNGKVIHIPLDEGPEKVTFHYDVIFHDLAKALDMDNEQERKAGLDQNRKILAYLNQTFEIGRLRKNMINLVEQIGFSPDTLIIDGLDFETVDRSFFEGLKETAGEFEAEVWLSALSHRHIIQVDARGIPYPLDRFDDFFSLILQLEPEASGLSLRLLKDREEHITSEIKISLDPNTLMLLDSVHP
jgi:hypothetical protein